MGHHQTADAICCCVVRDQNGQQTEQVAVVWGRHLTLFQLPAAADTMRQHAGLAAARRELLGRAIASRKASNLAQVKRKDKKGKGEAGRCHHSPRQLGTTVVSHFAVGSQTEPHRV